MHRLPKAQDDAGVSGGCEPRSFRLNFISTDGELLGPEKTLLIRCDPARLTRQRISHCDF